MKLYYSKGACSLAIRISLHEMGVKSDFEAVNLKTKQTEGGEDFLKINAKGTVPALQIDSHSLLTENAAIQIYLAETTHNTKMLPAMSEPRRYRVLEWLSYVSSDVHKSFGAFFNPTIPEELKETIFKPLLIKKYQYLNQHLEKNRYLTGDEFSIADSYLFVVLRWSIVAKVHLTEFPHLARYVETVKERKAVQIALKEEGLS